VIADDPPRPARHGRDSARRLTAITALTPARALHSDFIDRSMKKILVRFPILDLKNPNEKFLATWCEGQAYG
jgi:hypothetical protein